MTVTELLSLILSVYPGATPEAMKGVKSSFYGALSKHEGDTLQTAADAVVASFKPTMRQPFPIVADFSQHLPAGLRLGPEGSPIRAMLEERGARAKADFAVWHVSQGDKIRRNRPLAVADHCTLMALELAGHRTPLVLKQDEIAICEGRAVSQARLRLYGAIPRSEEEWRTQCAAIRDGWATERKAA